MGYVEVSFNHNLRFDTIRASIGSYTTEKIYTSFAKNKILPEHVVPLKTHSKSVARILILCPSKQWVLEPANNISQDKASFVYSYQGHVDTKVNQCAS